MKGASQVLACLSAAKNYERFCIAIPKNTRVKVLITTPVPLSHYTTISTGKYLLILP
jgi:hypothetical protein